MVSGSTSRSFRFQILSPFAHSLTGYNAITGLPSLKYLGNCLLPGALAGSWKETEQLRPKLAHQLLQNNLTYCSIPAPFLVSLTSMIWSTALLLFERQRGRDRYGDTDRRTDRQMDGWTDRKLDSSCICYSWGCAKPKPRAWNLIWPFSMRPRTLYLNLHLGFSSVYQKEVGIRNGACR